MKKCVLIFVLIMLFSIGVKAQMTYQHTYSIAPYASGLSVVNLLLSGKKYLNFDYIGGQIVLYNLNHSVWKTINLPLISGLDRASSYSSGLYASENLFKIDNKVDIALSYTDTSIASSVVNHLVVIDETGAIINRVDSIAYFEVRNIGADSFVAFLWNQFSRNQYVYSLPGTVPCDLCGGRIGLGMPASNGSGNASFMSEAMPNPSSEQTKIEYKITRGTTGLIRVYNTMGKELKSYKVDCNFDYITLDNSELPSGMYYYNLSTADGQTSAKKMVVIR